MVSWPCLSNMGSPKQRFDFSFQACGAELTLELPAHPDHPPMRWSFEANTEAVGLSFHSVDEVIARLSCPREADAIFDVSISKRADGGIHVVATGDHSQRLEFLAEGIGSTLPSAVAQTASRTPDNTSTSHAIQVSLEQRLVLTGYVAPRPGPHGRLDGITARFHGRGADVSAILSQVELPSR